MTNIAWLKGGDMTNIALTFKKHRSNMRKSGERGVSKEGLDESNWVHTEGEKKGNMREKNQGGK